MHQGSDGSDFKDAAREQVMINLARDIDHIANFQL